jgi:NAD(P)-dependent dehydrogenase (short-subunit alcohol dehydrogenase family)
VTQVLKTQVAIISGGLGDIGRAIALELSRLGADVALGDIREASHAADLLRDIEKQGSKARYDRVDVSDFEAVTGWIATVESELGVPTLIIPNAAIVAPAPVADLTAESWNRHMQVNLDGAFHLARAGASRMIQRQKSGRIVFIGSWAAHAPHPAITAYCVSKAGLRMLCKCMALELAGKGILVNEVAPGYVDAGLAKLWYDKAPEERDVDRKLVPIGQLIEPEDVAFEVAHLCDPKNQHMTGSTLLMDGGLSLVSTQVKPAD